MERNEPEPDHNEPEELTYKFTPDTAHEWDNYVEYIMRYHMKLLHTETIQDIDVGKKNANIPLYRNMRYHVDVLKDYSKPPFDKHTEIIDLYRKRQYEPNKFFWDRKNYEPRTYGTESDQVNWNHIMYQVTIMVPELEVMEKNFIHPAFLTQAEQCVQQLENCRDCYQDITHTPQYLRIQYLKGQLTEKQWRRIIHRTELQRFCAMDMIEVINRWIFDYKRIIDTFNKRPCTNIMVMNIIITLGFALVRWNTVCNLYHDVWMDMPIPDIFQPSYHKQCFKHHPNTKPLEPLVQAFKQIAMPSTRVDIQTMHQMAIPIIEQVNIIRQRAQE